MDAVTTSQVTVAIGTKTEPEHQQSVEHREQNRKEKQATPGQD